MSEITHCAEEDLFDLIWKIRVLDRGRGGGDDSKKQKRLN